MSRTITHRDRGSALDALLLGVLLLVALSGASDSAYADTGHKGEYLSKAKVFLAAADYRRALEACLREVWEAPSVESYVYLTYVYHAIDGYVEHLAKKDDWVRVGHLYLNLGSRGAEDVVDPPDVLVRIAKEIIQGSVRQQSDISAAMAARLDEQEVNRLWIQQKAWREKRPEDWWAGVPSEWGW